MLTSLIRRIVFTRTVLCKTYVDRFDSAHPGMVFTRTASDVEEQPFNLLRPGKGQLPAVAPAAIPSPGLDLARQQYLYHSIRPFVKPALQDILCPRPISDQPADVPADQPCGQVATRGRGGGRGATRGRGRGRAANMPAVNVPADVPVVTNQPRGRGRGATRGRAANMPAVNDQSAVNDQPVVTD